MQMKIFEQSTAFPIPLSKTSCSSVYGVLCISRSYSEYTSFIVIGGSSHFPRLQFSANETVAAATN